MYEDVNGASYDEKTGLCVYQHEKSVGSERHIKTEWAVEDGSSERVYW